MQRLIDFNDFLFNSLFESSDKNPLLFRLSNRLLKLLQTIDNPIARDLVDTSNKGLYKDSTLLDYDETDINKFSYVLSSKLYDYLSQKHHKDDPYTIHKLFNMYVDQGIRGEIWKLFRTSARIGGFVNRIFPDKYMEKEVESFVNAVKAKRTQQFENFKIVKGEDIRKYYLSENYDNRAGEHTSLGVSCMRYRKCQPFFDFYIINNVEMVLLMSNDDNQKDKIMGRAILWNIKNIDGEPVDRKFMDRIYGLSEYDVQTFKDYAIKNGWLYKHGQNRHPNESICDPIDNSCRERVMMTDTNYKKTKYYPYLDTMAFFYWVDGYLSNDGSLDRNTPEQPYFLQNTHGAYTLEGMKYVAYYQRLISEEDLQWCEYGHDWRLHDDAVYLSEYSEYATRQYLDEHDFKYSNIQDRWLNPEDDEIIYLDHQNDYVTRGYADRYMVYCDYDNEYYNRSDVVYSEYHESFLPKHKVVSVIVSDDNETDWRITDDNSYLKYLNTNGYQPKHKYYDKDVFGDKFVLCVDIKTYSQRSWKHKEWDGNKLVEYEGKWYYDMTQEEIEKYISKHEQG